MNFGPTGCSKKNRGQLVSTQGGRKSSNLLTTESHWWFFSSAAHLSKAEVIQVFLLSQRTKKAELYGCSVTKLSLQRACDCQSLLLKERSTVWQSHRLVVNCKLCWCRLILSVPLGCIQMVYRDVRLIWMLLAGCGFVKSSYTLIGLLFLLPFLKLNLDLLIRSQRIELASGSWKRTHFKEYIVLYACFVLHIL